MPKFALYTDKPVAIESPDHQFPRGVKQDNSRNPLFNKKLYALFPQKPLYILDFGCAGGGFVKDCVDDGHIAIGLEGSDYCKRTGRAEWSTIPEHLFTCDITAPFSLKMIQEESGDEVDMKFDVITAWEFMEHIRTEDLPQVCENARRHLRQGGLWIMSIADFEDTVGGVQYHQTVRPREWWEAFFDAQGFKNHPRLIEYFDIDWVRGPLQGSRSFHLVLTRKEEEAPLPPPSLPYSVSDMLRTAVMYIDRTIAGDLVSSMCLEYAVLLLSKVQQAGYDQPEELNYWRALALLHLGRLEDAEAIALAALSLQPHHVGAQRILEQVAQFSNLANIHPVYRQFTQRSELIIPDSLAGLEAVVALRPDDSSAAQRLREALKQIIRKLMDHKQWEAALILLSRFPEALPEDPEWHFMKARCLHEQGTQLDQALRQYDLALKYGYDASSVQSHRRRLLRERERPGTFPLDPAQSAGAIEARQGTLQTPREVHSGTAQRLAELQIAVSHLSHLGHRPKISIVTPSYNCAPYIRDCIESVLAQDYDNFEHIIVDGASTDGTVEIFQEYPHLQWISEPDGGEAEALNKALRMATGDIIGWLNADDCYTENIFSEIVERINPAQGRHLVYGKTVFIDEYGHPTHWVIPYAPINLVTLTRWFQLNLFQPSIFFTRALVQDVGPFREDLRYGTDYEYWLRIAVKGYTFHFIDRVLSKARIYRTGGKTETPYAVKAKEWLDICVAYHSHLTPHERTCFWRDYYKFWLTHQDSYFKGEPFDPPRNKEASVGLVWALRELELLDLYTLMDLADEHPDVPVILGLLAEALTRKGHYAEAKRVAEQAIALESRDAFPPLTSASPEFPHMGPASQRTMKRELSPPMFDKTAKRAVLFCPRNPLPPSAGDHRVYLATIQALRDLGYEVTLFSSTLFTVQPWHPDRIRELEETAGIDVCIHQACLDDLRFVHRWSKIPGWKMYIPPGLLVALRELCRRLEPELLLINYPLWGRLGLNEELGSAVRVLYSHDLAALNERMLRLLRPHFPIPVAPGQVDPAVLDEHFFARLGIDGEHLGLEEFRLYDQYDGTVAISPRDAQVIREHTSNTSVHYIPPSFPVVPLSNMYRGAALFVISDYELNVQGYLYFATRILPAVLREVPDFQLKVAGNGCRRVTPVEGVQLLNYVPDLKPLYAEARFAVCPLIGGTGMQVKVLEAMAHGVPVIVLRNLAPALPIQHGVNGLIAEDAAEFAEHVIRLWRDPILCRKLGDAARETIAQQFSPEVNVERWAGAIAAATANGRKRRWPKERVSLPEAVSAGEG